MSWCCAPFLRILGISSTIPPPTGPHDVGVLPFKFPNSCFSKIFYPAQRGGRIGEISKSLERIKELYGYNVSAYGSYRYTRRDVVEGISRWTGANKLFLNLSLGNNDIHFKWLLEPKEDSFPVIVFSHGLGGNADIYSKFCSDMASNGYIVIAMEHADGSGSFAFNEETKEAVWYERPPQVEYTRKNVQQWRGKQLKHRVEEINKILEFIREGEKSIESFRILPSLEKNIFEAMNTENIIMAGHSFGGATVATVLHHFNTLPNDDPLRSVFKAAIMLDVWPFPISDAAQEHRFGVPTISILSEGFTEMKSDYPITEDMMKGEHVKLHACMRDVTHTQFSDGPWFTGLSIVKSKGELEGSLSGIVSQKTIINTATKFLQSPANFSIDVVNDPLLINLKGN